MATFDAFCADGPTLRFLCQVKGERKEVAEKIDRKRVPGPSTATVWWCGSMARRYGSCADGLA